MTPPRPMRYHGRFFGLPVRRNLILYSLAILLAALAAGVHLVMIPWLATGHLHLSARQVGWVQAAQLLPGALLLLWSGAFADRAASPRYLPAVYLLLLTCHGLALWTLERGAMALTSLLAYGISVGAVFALIQPLRDRLLPAVVSERGDELVQHGVVVASMATYLGQALGMALAGQMDRLGMVPVFGLQMASLLLVAVLLLRLLPRLGLPAAAPAERHQPSVAAGLRYIRGHRVLRHLILLVAYNGFINLGVYLVALPLLVRDVYQRDAAFFSSLQLVFVVGNIIALLVLLKRGRVSQPGRSLLFCLAYTAVVMLAISAGPTGNGLLLLLLCWGAIAAVSASMGKSLLQQQVAEAYRGRVLSIYFLALLGGAPLGALVCGYMMDMFGAPHLFQVGGVLSLGLFLLYLSVPALWRVDVNEPQ